MAYALVGSPGALATGATGAAVTPAWGTGENRTVGNHLILRVLSVVVNTLPAAPAGWFTAVQVQGTSCTSSIFYKIAAGSDAAPTVAGVPSANLGAELAEFSGNAASPLDQTASAAGTTSPLVATATTTDGEPGELIVYACAVRLSVAATGTSAITLNNGATAHDGTNNNGTSSSNHWETGYGITTGNAGADSASFSYTTTNIVGAAVAIASFSPQPPPPVFPVFLPRNTLGRGIRNQGQIALMLQRQPHIAAVGPVTNQSVLSGVLSFIGSENAQTARALAGGLSFAGNLANQTNRALTATLSFAGSLARQAGKAFSGGLTFAGAIPRNVAHGVTAALTFSGSTARAVSHALVAASLSFAGTLSKTTRRTLGGVLSFAGGLVSNSVLKQAFAAGLSFAGSLAKTHAVGIVFNAVVSFAGSASRTTGKALIATVSASGSVGRAIRRGLTATLSFAGGIGRRIGRALNGALSYVGNLVGQLLTPSAVVFAYSGDVVATPTVAFSQATVPTDLGDVAVTPTFAFDQFQAFPSAGDVIVTHAAIGDTQ